MGGTRKEPPFELLEKEYLETDDPRRTGAHYQHVYKGILIDPYVIGEIYGPMHPAQFHAVKKILRAGKKPEHNVLREIDEAISSLKRWRELEVQRLDTVTSS